MSKSFTQAYRDVTTGADRDINDRFRTDVLYCGIALGALTLSLAVVTVAMATVMPLAPRSPLVLFRLGVIPDSILLIATIPTPFALVNFSMVSGEWIGIVLLKSKQAL